MKLYTVLYFVVNGWVPRITVLLLGDKNARIALNFDRRSTPEHLIAYRNAVIKELTENNGGKLREALLLTGKDGKTEWDAIVKELVPKVKDMFTRLD